MTVDHFHRRAVLVGAGASAVALSGFTTPAFAGRPMVGAPAPAITAIGVDGETVDLETLKGRMVVLEWTNHDCPFVVKHYGAGNMQATQTAASEAGAVWLQVISSAPGRQGYVEPAQAMALNAERDAVVSNAILDPTGQIGRRYHATTTPHMFVIDPDGRVAYMGAIDDIPSADKADIGEATNLVRAAVDAVARGETPPVQVSRPYGCSVKYAS